MAELYSSLEALSIDARYTPFVHRDSYGIWGLKPQTRLETTIRALLCVTIAPIKVSLALTGMLLTMLACRLEPFLPFSAKARAAWTVFWGRIFIRVTLFGIGYSSIKWVKVKPMEGDDTGEKPKEAAVIVSNHMGWSDILIHMVHSWPAFVAKEGIDRVPIVGYTSKHIGCIYALRESKNSGPSAAAQLRERITAKAANPGSSSRPMLIFPEGTTTNGRYLLNFKTGAFLAGVPVQPVIMHFTSQDHISPSWESIDIKRHFYIMMTTFFHSIVCYQLPLYSPSEAEKEDAVLFADNVRQYMLKYCGTQGLPSLIPSESTLESKIEYHRASKASILGHAKGHKAGKGE